MPLGIDPTVDYVFKKLFGDPKNADLLIHLLNAVLHFPSPVVEVMILNPFVEKDFEDDKLAILDVKARDSTGRWFNVAMQTSVPAGLPDRLVYYASCLYSDQLQEGQPFTELCPTISICFLSVIMFPRSSAPSHRFLMADNRVGLVLTDNFQVHTVELPKYNLSSADLATASDLEKWVYFLTCASKLEAAELKRLLNGPEYSKATGIVEMISRTPEERRTHDSRLRARRDYVSDIEFARQDGLQKGLERGLEQGEQIGKIQLLQQLLGEPVTAEMDLVGTEVTQLRQMADELQIRLSDRGIG